MSFVTILITSIFVSLFWGFCLELSRRKNNKLQINLANETASKAEILIRNKDYCKTIDQLTKECNKIEKEAVELLKFKKQLDVMLDIRNKEIKNLERERNEVLINMQEHLDAVALIWGDFCDNGELRDELLDYFPCHANNYQVVVYGRD